MDNNIIAVNKDPLAAIRALYMMRAFTCSRNGLVYILINCLYLPGRRCGADYKVVCD
jgi:hypothetical protein